MGLTEILSSSLHWSNVSQDLLDSLERDRVAMPEIYDQLAIRYRQEPYRLKLAYIQKRLEHTRDRNNHLANPEQGQVLVEETPENIYHSGVEFEAELQLI